MPLSSESPEQPVRAPRTAVAALLAAALLTACAAGPDYVAPTAPATTRFTATPVPNLEGEEQRLDASHAPAAAWWTLLAAPRLDALVQQALVANHSLASARATLAAARSLEAATDSRRYPQAELDALAGRQKYGVAFSGPVKFPPFTYYSIGPSVSYAFDFAGGVRRSIEAQRAQVQYTRHELEAAALTISGQVVQQALAAASARSQIERLQEQLDDDDKNLQLVHDAFDAGGATRVDVLTAQSQLDSDKAFMPPLQRALGLANHQLALLVGEAPADWAAPDFKVEEFTLPAQLPVAIPSELVHRRPDLLAAEAQLHAATAAVGVAAADLYPRISISATATLQANKLGSLFEAASAAGGLSGSLTAPLFNHGALKAKQRAAVENMNAALATYQQTVLHAFTEVADALESLNQDTEAVHSEQSAAATARENLALTRESYRVGNSGVLQVLEAQRQSGRARVELLRAKVQRFQDTVDLLLAVGGPPALAP
jgi:NodT family efflux transporter outer membrane factor (OMF) lipoprotein